VSRAAGLLPWAGLVIVGITVAEAQVLGTDLAMFPRAPPHCRDAAMARSVVVPQLTRPSAGVELVAVMTSVANGGNTVENGVAACPSNHGYAGRCLVRGEQPSVDWYPHLRRDGVVAITTRLALCLVIAHLSDTTTQQASRGKFQLDLSSLNRSQAACMHFSESPADTIFLGYSTW